MIEAALHAQYPEAQLKTVKDEDDFKHVFLNKVPDTEFDMLGSEYVLFKPQHYPIKTYKAYEKAGSGEYLNPLRHLLELMSNLKEGEYVWYQLVIVPEHEEWALSKRKEVDRLLGKIVPEELENKTILALGA